MRDLTTPLTSLLIVSLIGVAACSDTVEGGAPWDLDDGADASTNNGATDPGEDETGAPGPTPEPGRIPAYPPIDGIVELELPTERPDTLPSQATCKVDYRSDMSAWTAETTYGPYGPVEVHGGPEGPTSTFWSYDDQGRLIQRARGEAGSPGSEVEAWTYEAGHAIRYERREWLETRILTSTMDRIMEGDLPIMDIFTNNGEERFRAYYVYGDEGRSREVYYDDPATGIPWYWRSTYDDQGRLLSVEVTGAAHGGTVEQPAGVRYSYDEARRLQEATYIGSPADYKRLVWTDGRPTRIEGMMYDSLIEMDITWDPDTGALRSQEGSQDGQPLITWSYEGDGCWKSARELSLEASFLMPGTLTR